MLNLVRPKHWIKNFLVFAPLFFAWTFTASTFVTALMAFVAFSATASSIYVINDLADADADRRHPEKKNRPIAAGTVSPTKAQVIIAVLIIIALLGSFSLPLGFQLTILGYFVLNLLYSFYLKKRPIIDVMILATGFVLRIIGGGFAFGISLSPWILLCTFFASLFIGFGKRKNETDVLQADSHHHRAVLEHYTPDFINQLLGITAAMTIMSYSLYTIDVTTLAHFGHKNLVYSVPFVVYGVFRYFHLMYNRSSGGDPTKVFLSDTPLILDTLAWLISFGILSHFF